MLRVKSNGPILVDARSLIKAGLFSVAEKYLRGIINEAPGTKIATEAQQVMDSISAKK